MFVYVCVYTYVYAIVLYKNAFIRLAQNHARTFPRGFRGANGAGRGQMRRAKIILLDVESMINCTKLCKCSLG